MCLELSNLTVVFKKLMRSVLVSVVNLIVGCY